ncbi:MAG TPA: leucine-rich repeat domain-containing protein, partial [Ruminococcus flavefaciens]|nr:leucine-rich repeat domain-containing protein [Ruminococcus flavefaciens]
MKKILAIITSAVLCFSAAAVPQVSAAKLSTPTGVVSENKTDAEGKCGKNATWKLSGGTLTISGSGKMVEWQSSSVVPWSVYINDIRNVVIESGITNIGRAAFYNASNLTSVTIPSTVTA